MSRFLSGWLMSPPASTTGPQIDHLYNLVLLITGVVFVLTELALILFSFQYRARPGRKASPTHGNAMAEIIWTTIPAAIMVALGFLSQNLWARLKQPDQWPQPEMVVN